MTKYSQRDPRWKNKILGTKGTIGEYGCLVTCLAMLLDTPPDVVNDRLKAVYGYDQGNLLVWGRIAVAYPQLRFLRRSYVYNNADVRNNIPCLVEVDGAPIGGFRHWVLFIGNQRMYDPWTGQERSTSVYPLKGYSIVKKR